MRINFQIKDTLPKFLVIYKFWMFNLILVWKSVQYRKLTNWSISSYPSMWATKLKYFWCFFNIYDKGNGNHVLYFNRDSCSFVVFTVCILHQKHLFLMHNPVTKLVNRKQNYKHHFTCSRYLWLRNLLL